MKVPPLPFIQTVAPRTPEFRGVAGDFEPVVANEREVVCGPLCHWIRHVFPILCRLELPERVDNTKLESHDCTLGEIAEAAGPLSRWEKGLVS